ncbi:MAG: hypothetical protein QXQ94_09050 [Candidatus Bathyarchaeia archaeon]
MKQGTSSSDNALKASRIGVFAALYVITSLVPISMFIGAPSFLALNLIITPVIAVLLPPLEAFFASLFGGVIALYVSPSQAMFGPYTILLPVVGATLGSLTYHKARPGALATSIFLVGAITSYLIKNYPFPYFIVPHSVAIAFAVVSALKRMTPPHLKIPLYTYISTMTEQGMMMIFAVHLLGLPWQVFVGVLPLMIYERLVGTVGAAAMTISLLKVLPKYFTE